MPKLRHRFYAISYRAGPARATPYHGKAWHTRTAAPSNIDMNNVVPQQHVQPHRYCTTPTIPYHTSVSTPRNCAAPTLPQTISYRPEQVSAAAVALHQLAVGHNVSSNVDSDPWGTLNEMRQGGRLGEPCFREKMACGPQVKRLLEQLN